MHRLKIALLLILFASFGADAVWAQQESKQEKEAYGSLGYSIAQSLHLGDLKWSEAQFDAFVQGLKASYERENFAVSDKAREMSRQILQSIAQVQEQPTPAEQPHDSDALKSLVKQFGMQRSENGMFVRVLHPGMGSRPRPEDTVIVSFSCRALGSNADLPELSRDHLRIKVADLLPGIQEGLRMLALTGQAVVMVPPSLSFGQGRWPAGLAPGTSLVFIIALEDIVAPDAVP